MPSRRSTAWLRPRLRPSALPNGARPALRAGRPGRPPATVAGRAHRDSAGRGAFAGRRGGDLGCDEERRAADRIRRAARPGATDVWRPGPPRPVRCAGRALSGSVRGRPARAAGGRDAPWPPLPDRRPQILEAPPSEGWGPRRGIARGDDASLDLQRGAWEASGL